MRKEVKEVARQKIGDYLKSLREEEEEEEEKMRSDFQSSFEAVIDYHEDAINAWIKELIEV